MSPRARGAAARAADVLRALLLAALALAAVLVFRDDGGGGTLTAGPEGRAELLAALVSPRPPAHIAWSDAAGPDGQALWLLTPGPAVPPLTLPVGTLALLRASPPERPVAGRAAAIAATLHGTPGDTVRVRWRSLLGGMDSLKARLGPDGRATIGLRVRPAAPGWHTWTVLVGRDPSGAGGSPATATPDSVEVGAWVAPERPVRVLALAGTPDWESRFALRALDEAGIDVDARFDLGRVAIAPSGSGVDASDWSPDDYDVVLVLGGAAPSTSAVRALVDFARRGGGVLLGPAPADPEVGRPVASELLDSLGLASAWHDGPTLTQGAEPTWALPAELSPLPTVPARASTRALERVDAAARVVARGPGGEPLAAVRALGRGRAAALGLAESWRWRMEGGRADAHRAWWRAWVEWAASGLRAGFAVSVPDRPVPTGSVVRVRVEALDSGASLPRTLRLERPNGAVEVLPTLALTSPGEREARFLAAQPGPHRLSWDGGETGVQATDEPPAPAPSERALVAIASSRGTMRGLPLPPGEVEPEERSDAQEPVAEAAAPSAPTSFDGPWRPASTSPLPWWLGALIGALAVVEWTVRRLRAGR
jgi:hypothetical protein